MSARHESTRHQHLVLRGLCSRRHEVEKHSEPTTPQVRGREAREGRSWKRGPQKSHRRFPAVLLRIYFAHCRQRELPSLPCSTPALGAVTGATTVQNGGRLLLLCLGVGQGIHEPWHTMCTHTHSLLPVCQEGHYRTPGERGSGLLEIVEIRGMLEVRGREERGEKK